MNNKIFLVCPFSQMENFIKAKFGEDVFFLAAMGGVFDFNDKKYLQAVKNFIVRENIEEIIFVSETSCRFINNALRHGLHCGSNSENVIRKLLVDEKAAGLNRKSVTEQQKRLAELIVEHQAGELMKSEIFRLLIVKNRILVKGLITTREIDKISEVPISMNYTPRGSLKM